MVPRSVTCRDRAHHLLRGDEMAKGTCSEAGCTRAIECRGYCGRHYMKARREGRLTTIHLTTSDRFWAKVDTRGFVSDHRPDLGACWIWTAAHYWDGYGAFAANGVQGRAHRFAYELLVGPIPDGLQIDHLCRVRLCVNPSHMEPVTLGENVMRGVGFAPVNAAKTHCIHGHAFTPENTYVARKTGWRHCKTCVQAQQRQRRERQSP